MAAQHRRKPAPARTGNGLSKSDRLEGATDPQNNTSGSAAQSHFGFQCYRVLSDPVEVIKASIDPRLIGLFRRILRGGHDCAICRTTLNLDPESSASPGLMGYAHGNIDVAMAACVTCTLRLGDEGAERAMCQEFADEIGGKVEVLQAGRA